MLNPLYRNLLRVKTKKDKKKLSIVNCKNKRMKVKSLKILTF